MTLFLALEQGPAFATAAAEGTLEGLISVAAFCVVYGRLARRQVWPLTLTGALLTFLASTWTLQRFSWPLPAAICAVLLVLTTALVLLPSPGLPPAAAVPPRWDIPARVLLSTAFVLLLTGLADVPGPRLSGLLAPLPIFAGTLTTFAHRLQGAGAAVALLQGVLLGSYAFAAFFTILTVLLKNGNILLAFAGAALAALAVQGVSMRLLRLGQPQGPS